MRVLVVDDNDSNLEYARQVLVSRWDVTVAAGGAEALEALAAGAPDLLLLDLSMPGVDGWEVLNSVRSNPATKALTVVACSAHAMAGDKERALAAGFDAYLAKPFRSAELVEMVSHFLGITAPSEDHDAGWGGEDWSLEGGGGGTSSPAS
ncbi:MAG: response regulator [Planctomycetes bacterium]|nr:response regulator [Planctomycetota bacterium]